MTERSKVVTRGRPHSVFPQTNSSSSSQNKHSVKLSDLTTPEDFCRFSVVVLQYSLHYSAQYLSYLEVWRRQTHRTDELVELHPLAQPQQRDVVVVVVGFEVWMEDDSLH